VLAACWWKSCASKTRHRWQTRPCARLKNVTPSGSGWSARCPAHADSKNSLSVADGDVGRVLLYCHVGCDIQRILEVLGLQMRDLFARHQHRRPLRNPRKEAE
jgi:hypothetical protein